MYLYHGKEHTPWRLIAFPCFQSNSRVSTSEPSKPGPISVRENALVISWTPPSSPNGIVIGYNVSVGVQGHSSAAIPCVRSASFQTDQLDLNLNELCPDTLYFIEVKARTSAGTGPGQNVSVLTKGLSTVICDETSKTYFHNFNRTKAGPTMVRREASSGRVPEKALKRWPNQRSFVKRFRALQITDSVTCQWYVKSICVLRVLRNQIGQILDMVTCQTFPTIKSMQWLNLYSCAISFMSTGFNTLSRAQLYGYGYCVCVVLS